MCVQRTVTSVASSIFIYFSGLPCRKYHSTVASYCDKTGTVDSSRMILALSARHSVPADVDEKHGQIMGAKLPKEVDEKGAKWAGWVN